MALQAPPLTLAGTPLYGTVRAGAWHGVHPQAPQTRP